MSFLDRLRARRAHARLLRIVGLDRRPARVNAGPRPVDPYQARFQVARHLAMAETATLSVDLDLLARDLGVEVREYAALASLQRCDAMMERLSDGIWRLSLAEGLSSDDRRLLVALLLALRAERPLEADQMRLGADDVWQEVSASPEAYTTALSFLAPPGSLRVLARAFPADPASQARRLRLGVALLRLAQRGHVMP
jgi:hypothetical protein